MVYYNNINGHDVWVSVLQPKIWDQENQKAESQDKYCCAFKFSPPSVIIEGEFVRDNESNEVSWFDTEQEAINAGFQAAIRKMN